MDSADAVAALGAATGSGSAGTARAAVRLIATALGRRPELVTQVAAALSPALTHRRPEVQLDALTVLRPYAGQPGVAAALRAAAPELSPSVAAALPAELVPTRSSDDEPDLLVQARVFLAEQPDADLAAALAAAAAGIEAPRVDCQPWRDARFGADAVAPVETLDDLVESLLHVVDGSHRSTIVIERALDGLAALHPDRPDDFGLRVGPLIVRVNQLFESERPSWGDAATTDFCYLVAQWIQPHRPVAQQTTVDSPRTWLIERLREVALMIQQGLPARLLALPTDMADWIDPPVLAGRVIALGDIALARPYDVAVAIARLAPWGRAQALQLLRDVPGLLAATVRAACGAGDCPDDAPQPVRRMVTWLRTTPPAGAPYRYGEAAAPPPPREGLDLEMMRGATFELQPNGSMSMNLDNAPGWHAFQHWQTYELHGRYAPEWGVSQWPGYLDWVWDDPLLSHRFIQNLLDPESSLPDTAVGRVAGLLSDDKAEVRALAVDILAQAVGDGRLTSAELAKALRVPWERAGRVATGLATAAAAGPLQRAVVARALLATAPTWTTLPARPLCTVLELLDEIFAVDGTGVTGSAREAIGALANGRGKTAALATRVLAHDSNREWPSLASAAAVRARLERAQRR